MANPNLSITGASSLTANQITSWASKNGHEARYVSASILQLAGWYVSEGNAQGIRGDVAFAQACLETGYFSLPSAANLLAKNNFAGVDVPTSSSPGWGWSTPQLGVRAHIQLLAEVVGGNGVPMANAPALPTNGDPLTWGGRQASTWGGLSGNWAADTSYASKIMSIYNSMLGGNPVNTDGATTPSNATGAPLIPLATPAAATMPGIDPTWRAPKQILASTFSWLYSTANNAVLARAITTESTVDLTYNMLSEVQLTIIDPTLELTQGMPGAISIDGTPGPRVLWAGETMALEEVQTTSLNDVPAMIATLRPAVLAWMSTQRKQESNTLSNVQWIASKVAEYNDQLPAGVTPATFSGDQRNAGNPNPFQLNIPAPAVQWQSYYDQATTLAQQEGCWLIETGGGVFYGPPTWFAANFGPMFRVNWKGLKGYPNPYSQPGADVECLGVPVCLRSDQLFTGDTMVLQLPHDFGEQVRVGQPFTLSGVPYWSSETWIVTEVQWNFDGQQTPVQVTANEVKDPVPSNLNGTNAPALPPQTDPTGRSPQATADDFVDLALATFQRVRGEGGAAYSEDPSVNNSGSNDLNGGASSVATVFDCSSFVQWCLRQLGISFPRTSGEQYTFSAAVGAAIPVPLAEITRGALVFVGPNGSDHVAISLGTGQGPAATYVQAANSRLGVISGRDLSDTWSVACRIPELTYPSDGS